MSVEGLAFEAKNLSESDELCHERCSRALPAFQLSNNRLLSRGAQKVPTSGTEQTDGGSASSFFAWEES